MAGIEGKVAWVTGGGSGIGLASAVALAREGATVVISGRSQASLDSGLAAVRAAGRAEAVRVDVARRDAVEAAVAGIEQRHGRIDIVVNSAGTNASQRNFADMTAGIWDDIVAINLSGLFYCCYAAIPGMRARGGGLIINVSSWAGRYASKLTGPAYNATKRGVIALTESINIEECANGIRATSVLPGEVATPLMEKRPVPPSVEERARMLQPEDLGDTIAYLARLPPRACVSELIIAPTWNRFYLGGFEAPKR